MNCRRVAATNQIPIVCPTLALNMVLKPTQSINFVMGKGAFVEDSKQASLSTSCRVVGNVLTHPPSTATCVWCES